MFSKSTKNFEPKNSTERYKNDYAIASIPKINSRFTLFFCVWSSQSRMIRIPVYLQSNQIGAQERTRMFRKIRLDNYYVSKSM